MDATKNIVSKICVDAKKTCLELADASTDQKNKFLYDFADLIKKNKNNLFTANKKDILQAKKNGHNDAFIDRLEINEETLLLMADGLIQIALLPDPVGEIINVTLILFSLAWSFEIACFLDLSPGEQKKIKISAP